LSNAAAFKCFIPLKLDWPMALCLTKRYLLIKNQYFFPPRHDEPAQGGGRRGFFNPLKNPMQCVPKKQAGRPIGNWKLRPLHGNFS